MTAPAPELPRALVDFHRENNRATAHDWQGFAPHRERMTSLVAEAAGDASARGRLAVLGAGNCNDLDLVALAARFAELHLVDLDPEALRRARERQPPEVASVLTLHAPVDLSGALGQMAAFKRKTPSEAQVQRLPDASADAVVAALPGPFDVVVSACMLSQLMHGCYLALGSTRHPLLRDLATATAFGHLRSLARLVAPGGTALVITDVVSSETYPLEELWGTRPGTELLRELEAAENVFSGTAPSMVRHVLVEDEVIAPLLERPRLIEPWLWQLGPEITVLVYGYACRAKRS